MGGYLMACVTTTATNSIIKLRELSRTLSLVRNNNWWNYPNLYRITSSSNNTWEFSDPATNEDGTITSFQFTSRVDYALFTDGYQLAKDAINQTIVELDLVLTNLPREGGEIKFKRATLDALKAKATANRDRLIEVKDSLFLDVRYGGRSVIPAITILDVFNLAQGLEIFVITSVELAELRYVASVLGRASDDLMDIVDSLSYGDCTDEETDDDNDDGNNENCDRIATALEAIAAKEFNCDIQPVLDSIEELKASIEEIQASMVTFDNVKVPKSINNPPKNNKATDDDYILINSIPEFLVWQFKQFDALIGRFPIKLTQTDSDIVEDGNQEKTLIIPNLSEAIAELLAMNMVNTTNLDATLHASISSVGEVVTARKMIFQCKSILDNLQEWTGITIKERIAKMPSTVDVTASKLTDYLTPTDVDVLIDDYQASDDGSEFDIDRIGKIVNTIYAIVSAVYVNRLNKNDIEGSIKRDLEKIKQGTDLIDDEDEDTFSQFLERVEIGFTDAVASSQLASPKPYGRDRERRPLVRRSEGAGLDDIQDNDSGDGDNP